MDDYKLVDELLLDLMRERNLQPCDVAAGHLGYVGIHALDSVRKSYANGLTVTVTWARFFDTSELHATSKKGGV